MGKRASLVMGKTPGGRLEADLAAGLAPAEARPARGGPVATAGGKRSQNEAMGGCVSGSACLESSSPDAVCEADASASVREAVPSFEAVSSSRGGSAAGASEAAVEESNAEADMATDEENECCESCSTVRGA